MGLAQGPFPQSRSSRGELCITLAVAAVGMAIPFSPLGAYMGFSTLPKLYWPLLTLTLVCKIPLTQGLIGPENAAGTESRPNAEPDPAVPRMGIAQCSRRESTR